MSSMVEKIMNAEHVAEYSVIANGDLQVEHAELAFRNFSGRGTKANPVGGKRTFCLMLNEEMADRLWNDNWNVKVKEIKDQYQEDETTLTVNWEDYNRQYRNIFDHAMIYTEIIVSENGNPPADIYKASEYNGEKTVAKIPADHWKELDTSMMNEITVTIHPWMHGRNLQKPDAKKGYLRTLIAHVQPIMSGVRLGNTYSDYRVIED